MSQILSYRAQDLLDGFNPAFAPLIIMAIATNFLMCIALFFDFVILAGTEGEMFNTVLYLGNGLQYLFRSSHFFLYRRQKH